MNCADRAEALFYEGYNCAQSVFGAIAEDVGMDRETALRLSSSFGGGIGRLREVCGACSAIFMGAGLLWGYSTPEEGEIKSGHYELVRRLAGEFKRENGSIICRELLGEGAEIGGTPEKRTEEYYAGRPCVHCIRSAAEIFEKILAEKNGCGK
ncbi:MAG: C-GCAxxG-C-C family protein [Clostridiales bacterium]|nr:C-GCAxxG-C-C family protein [Clostridiales bacterium]